MRLFSICSAILFLLMSLATPCDAADKFESERTALKSFLKAFAVADTDGMLKYYAPEVTVLRGSTLLDPNCGGLGNSNNREKDLKVKKKRFAAAYKRSIQKLGGTKDWKRRGEKLLTQNVRFLTVDEQLAKASEKRAASLQIGDALGSVVPKGDSLTFVFRKQENGRRLIVAEHWN